MKKLPIIAKEFRGAVMDEVSEEISKVMAEIPNKEERIAFSTFFGTLVKMMLDTVSDLSSEEQEDILAAYGTWFNIGMLAGRSPRLLLDILKRTKPRIEAFTPPEWFLEKDRAIAEAEEIVKKAGGKLYL